MVHHSWIHEKKFNARGTFLGRVYTRLICNSIYKRTSYVANVDLPQFLVRPVYVIKITFYLYAFCVDNCLQFFIKTMLGYTKWRLLFSFQKHLRTKYCTSHSFTLKSHCNPFRKLLHSMRLKFNYVIKPIMLEKFSVFLDHIKKCCWLSKLAATKDM